jgi:anthranilate/para-aminobenzoate synthase component I
MSPLDAAARLAGKRGRVLLHSACTAGGLGRRSFAAAEPHTTLIGRGHSLVELDAAGRPIRRFTGDPLDAAEAFLAEHGCRREPHAGGDPEPRVIGYLGYDLARVVERLPGGAALGHDGPDLWLAAYGAVARWSDGELAITGADREARARLGAALARPARPRLAPSLGPIAADDDAHHRARIERVRDHLAAGDVEEVHLARRLTARIAAPGDALAVYAALADVAPAPFGGLLETDGTALIQASSERFLAAADAGAGASAAAAGYAALLRATFPHRSVTGAPRLRAMQLIDELEPVRRGPYGGALGYFGPGGAFDLALAVGIGVIAQGELRVAIGGRIAGETEAGAGLAATEREAAGWVAALDRLDQIRATPPARA